MTTLRAFAGVHALAFAMALLGPLGDAAAPGLGGDAGARADACGKAVRKAARSNWVSIRLVWKARRAPAHDRRDRRSREGRAWYVVLLKHDHPGSAPGSKEQYSRQSSTAK